MKLETTLNEIRKHDPCLEGYQKLLASLGKTKADDEPFSFRHILKSNGPEDFMWCLRVLPDEMDNAVRLLVCDVVEPAMRFVPEGETRPQAAIDAARAFARGEISEQELATARSAARSAARDATWAAAWAATVVTITKWLNEMETTK